MYKILGLIFFLVMSLESSSAMLNQPQVIPATPGPCVLPPYSAHGTYTVGTEPGAEPGQTIVATFLPIWVSCEPGYTPERDVLYCVGGLWYKTPRCMKHCRLEADPSKTYHCIEDRRAVISTYRPCNDEEPYDTIVKVECNANYEKLDTSDRRDVMWCEDGTWSRNITCSPVNPSQQQQKLNSADLLPQGQMVAKSE